MALDPEARRRWFDRQPKAFKLFVAALVVVGTLVTVYFIRFQ